MSPPVKILRIATRKSPLALVQAQWVALQLQKYHPELIVEFVALATGGDRHLSSRLVEVGGKGLFVKELEQALLDHEADIAVHSMKDMTAAFPEGLGVPVICERADPRDVLVAQGMADLFTLPAGARVGTSSLRRQCQLLAYRPDLNIVDLRGNVNTRLQKLDEGAFDALVLAAAGLERLDLGVRVSCQLSTEVCLPAPGQGALGVECRIADDTIQQLIAPLNDPTTFYEVKAERAFSARLNGGCRAPIAAFAQVCGDRLLIRGLVGRPDGTLTLRSQRVGQVCDARSLGELLAEELLAQGADDIIQALI